METTQDHTVVMAIVLILGLIAISGLIAVAVLIAKDKPSESIALVAGFTGTALGALPSLLAQTRTQIVAEDEQQAVGYQQAVDDVNALSAPSAPTKNTK